MEPDPTINDDSIEAGPDVNETHEDGDPEPGLGLDEDTGDAQEPTP